MNKFHSSGCHENLFLYHINPQVSCRKLTVPVYGPCSQGFIAFFKRDVNLTIMPFRGRIIKYRWTKKKKKNLQKIYKSILFIFSISLSFIYCYRFFNTNTIKKFNNWKNFVLSTLLSKSKMYHHIRCECNNTLKGTVIIYFQKVVFWEIGSHSYFTNSVITFKVNVCIIIAKKELSNLYAYYFHYYVLFLMPSKWICLNNIHLRFSFVKLYNAVHS